MHASHVLNISELETFVLNTHDPDFLFSLSTVDIFNLEDQCVISLISVTPVPGYD